MPKTVAKILDMLSGKIIERYKPVVIGVFDDDDGGMVSVMIRELLEKRYAVHLSDPVREPGKDVPYAVIGAESAARGGTGAMVRGMGLALRKDGSYPNIIILRMEACESGGMKSLLGAVRPDIAVFAAGETCRMNEPANKRQRRRIGEKSLLFRSLRKNDLAIFCADDETIKAMAMKSRCSKMTFGYGEGAKVRGRMFSGEGGSGEGTSFKISYRGTIVPFHFSSGGGEREVCAALAAAAAGLHMGFNLVEISEALRR